MTPMQSTAPDALTVLASPTLATKLWTPLGCEDFHLPEGPFGVSTVEVVTLHDIARMLTTCSANQYHIRGAVIPEMLRADGTIPYRRFKRHGFAEPTLVPRAHRVIPVDMDVPGTDPMRGDLASHVRAAREILPTPFCNAECVAQATSGAYLKPGVRVRLWFLNDVPFEDHDLKLWFEPLKKAGVDPSIYRADIPIYIAPPRFQGVQDPCPDRVLILPGEPLCARKPTAAPGPAMPGVRAQLDGFNEMAGGKVVEGGRNTFLTSEAGRARRIGLAESAILEHLRVCNAKQCVPPLEDSDLQTIASSVANYEPSAVAKPVLRNARAATKALKRASERLEDDPGLLESLCLDLKPHIASGALSEAEVVSKLVRAVQDSDPTRIAPMSRSDIERALRDAPLVTEDVRVWAQNLHVTADGTTPPSAENLAIILVEHPDFALWWDTRALKAQWAKVPFGTRAPRPVDDTDDFAMRAWLAKNMGWCAIGCSVRDAFNFVAQKTPHDSWRGYLDSLQWDGVPRVLRVAPEILAAAEHVEAVTVGWWLISSVARTYKPGCQVDHVLVLEGPQGIGKTSFLRELVTLSAFFGSLTHQTLDFANPRMLAALHGPVVIEIPEFSAFNKRDAESIKAGLDRTHDQWIPMYGHAMRDDARTCVFVGTVNQTEYLRDDENRRFWPVACTGRIDIPKLREWRDQIWAEAVHLFKSGTPWWPTPEQAAELGLAGRVAARRAYTAATEILAEALATPRKPGEDSLRIEPWQLDAEGRLVRATLTQLVELSGSPKDTTHALKALKWTHGKVSIPGRGQIRLWQAPGVK